jgi:hypothetical protein
MISYASFGSITIADDLIVLDNSLQVYGPEATMTGICKQAIDCIMAQ